MSDYWKQHNRLYKCNGVLPYHLIQVSTKIELNNIINSKVHLDYNETKGELNTPIIQVD